MSGPPRGKRQPQARAAAATNTDAQSVDPVGLFDVHVGAYGGAVFDDPPRPRHLHELGGAARRDQGLRRSAQPQANRLWLRGAEDAIRQLCADGTPFTAEDVRRIVGDPPASGLPGTAIRAAKLAGLIEPAGVDTASRPEAHARITRLWRRRGSGHGR